MQISIQTHWTTSANCRDELIVLIGFVDWSRVNWQGILPNVLTNKFKDITEDLKSSLPVELFNQVIDFVDRVQSSQYITTKERHKNKFDRLKKKGCTSRSDLDKNWRANNACNKDVQDKWVKNLSDRKLTESENSLLCKGVGYAVTSKTVSILDLITATETAIKQAKLDTSES